MADTKITALTAITTVDPAADVLPIVDVSDTSMAASGTTKKITSNQILGAGGTATLASATITGDLTVDTSTLKVDSANDRVGIGTATPGGALEVFKNTNGQNRLFLNNPSTGTGAYDAIDFTAGTANNQILSMGSGYSGSFPYLTGALLLRSAQANGIVLNTAGSAAAIQFGINDTLAMTLNATGLGVGVASPSAKLHISGNLKIDGATSEIFMATGAERTISASGSAGATALTFKRWDGVSAYVSDVIFNGSGNVGIGVTPSAWINFKALQVQYACFASNRFGAGNIQTFIGSNTFYDGSGYKYIVSDTAARYALNDNVHAWYNAPSGTAGNAITFTQAMTLESTGSLVLGAAAVATTATDGFLYIPGCAGTPTGTPTAKTGRVPLVVDTTNNKLYFYSGGAWVAAN